MLDIDETGVTETFQSQTLKMSRYCVRKRLNEKDADDGERQNSLRRGDDDESKNGRYCDGEGLDGIGQQAIGFGGRGP